MTSPKLDVLVSGSGIAGPAFAFWLHKLVPVANITILERSPVPRFGGQAVDLRSASVRVVERMGLLQTVKKMHTSEEGVQFVYADGKTMATFTASGNEEAQSMTSEYEIIRGDLAKIFLDETEKLDRVKYIFGDMVTALEDQPSGKVRATFANGLPPTEYDIVVGADGMMSRTRRILFGTGPNDDNYLYRLGQYAAFFTIPRTSEDTKYAQWYNATGGRLVFLRPDPYGTTRAYLAVTDGNLARFDEIDQLLRKGTRKEQEAWFEREFEGAGFQTERVVREMKKSEDFYMQQIGQVKLDQWVKGSVALLGDAAYCPSPISGVGAGSAIVGAYVLAGEISRSLNDIPHALVQYQERMRPYVKSVQRLVPGAPQIANPQTAWGVWAFNTATGVMASKYAKALGNVAGRFLPAFAGTGWPLPDYGSADGK